MTTRRREKEKTAVLFHHASVTPLRRKPNEVCTISFSTSFSSSANSALLLVLVVQSQSLLSQKQGKLELSERLKLWWDGLEMRYEAVHHIFGKNHSGKEFKLVLGSL